MKAQKPLADVYNPTRANPGLWDSTPRAVLDDEDGGFHAEIVGVP